jgi:nicotinamidase-related amidase
MGEKAEILKIRLADFLSTFSKMKVFIREKHATEDAFFINDSTHSVATTEDFQVHESLKKYVDRFYDKIRYSAFYGNDQLETFLKLQKVKTVGVVGVETHTSILFTVEELRNRGYEVTVIEPCAMSRDDYLHGYALTLMKNCLGVRITNG